MTEHTTSLRIASFLYEAIFSMSLEKIIPRQDGGFFPLLEGGAAVDEPRGDGLAGGLGTVPGTLAAAAATDGKLFVRVEATTTP